MKPIHLLVTIGFSFIASLANANGMVLKSTTIRPNSKLIEDHVYNGYGCTGKNISPALSWTKGPKGTKSYAITVYDPDAPTGSGWWHWLVYNLPANVTELAAGAGDSQGKQLPANTIQGRTDFGTTGFGGACSPQGDKPHRYIFTVHALKIEKINLPLDANAAMIEFTINANRLEKASFTATYGRK
jgi:Raf kinase inhibitor-like YbhB/YbcL family protein